MDMWENWEFTAPKDYELEKVAHAIARCSHDGVLKYILQEVFDTDDVAYILCRVAGLFEADLTEATFEQYGIKRTTREEFDSDVHGD